MSSKYSNRPSFETLDAALSFIESQLNEGNATELFNACVDDRATDFMRPLIFERLQAIHADKKLSSMYLDRSPPLTFPANDKRLKLGGHDQELGHIHIDFQKRGCRWQLA